MVSWHRNLAFPLTLAASAFLGSSPADIDSQDGKPKPTVYETVVYRQARGPKTEAGQAFKTPPRRAGRGFLQAERRVHPIEFPTRGANRALRQSLSTVRHQHG
jgi:hypothetical protein